MRIDTVHYCDREAGLSARRKRSSFIGRNGALLKDPPQERLHLFSRSVRENRFLAAQVFHLKIPYITREICKADLARTVSALPNLRYVDLPDGFYNNDPSSNALRQELQARCGDIRHMKYASGAEESFQRLARAGHWPNLEALELLHLAVDPAMITDVFKSLKALRHIKFTNLHLLDDSMFGSMRMSQFPPVAVLEFRHAPNISAKGLLAYLSCPEVKQTLNSLTLANTGVSPLDLFRILDTAPSLTTLHVAENVSRALPQSQNPLLASSSLRVLYYEISSANSLTHSSSSPSDSYYSCLSSSILSGYLPSLSQLYALSASFPAMLLQPPRHVHAPAGTNNLCQSVTTVVSRPLSLYTKDVIELEWNLTLIHPPSLVSLRGSATTTRPMSLYLKNQRKPWWKDARKESAMVGNGFGGFLAVPSENPSKIKKGQRDVDAWMG